MDLPVIHPKEWLHIHHMRWRRLEHAIQNHFQYFVSIVPPLSIWMDGEHSLKTHYSTLYSNKSLPTYLKVTIETRSRRRQVLLISEGSDGELGLVLVPTSSQTSVAISTGVNLILVSLVLKGFNLQTRVQWQLSSVNVTTAQIASISLLKHYINAIHCSVIT